MSHRAFLFDFQSFDAELRSLMERGLALKDATEL